MNSSLISCNKFYLPPKKPNNIIMKKIFDEYVDRKNMAAPPTAPDMITGLMPNLFDKPATVGPQRKYSPVFKLTTKFAWS
jgi:hypothetical protein